ncbi:MULTISPECIES: hypothetical protein [Acetobacter]|uniref:hypothetical protein n=1 Tax=Acetobacter TaxID=434 RepID=UPI001122C7B3|nr:MULTISPECIES: hypothetical protein [Acetobacter]
MPSHNATASGECGPFRVDAVLHQPVGAEPPMAASKLTGRPYALSARRQSARYRLAGFSDALRACDQRLLSLRSYVTLLHIEKARTPLPHTDHQSVRA